MATCNLNINKNSSSITLFRNGLYVLVGLVSGQKEPVLLHRNLFYLHRRLFALLWEEKEEEEEGSVVIGSSSGQLTGDS